MSGSLLLLSMNNHLKIIGENAGEILLSSTMSSLSDPETSAGVQTLGAKGDFGYLSLQEIAGNGYYIRHHNFYLNQDDSFTFIELRPALKLWISLRHSFYYTLESLGKGSLHEWGFNIHYAASTQHTFHLISQQSYAFLEIHFSLEYLRKLTPFFPGVEGFLQEIEEERSVFLKNNRQIATIQMIRTIESILYCNYPAAVRKKYIDNKVMETLILAMENISNTPLHLPVSLDETIVRGVYKARDLILKNLDRNYTLRELGIIVGISQYNLTKGFKVIYGLSLPGFLHEARMQKARLLLKETDLPVARIAEAIGYTHPFSFSSAFKKYFGYTPSVIQQSRKKTTPYN